MWTEITRPKYDREGLRYASDLTDREWELIAPFLPPAKAVGRPRTTDLREVVKAAGPLQAPFRKRSHRSHQPRKSTSP